jgi:hypothetical protein
MEVQNRRVLLLAIFVFMLLIPSFAAATTTVFTAGYDNGDSGAGWGGSAAHYPEDGQCWIFMNAVGASSEAWAWIGSEISFTSTKSVYMDAVVHLQAYIAMNIFGSGELRIYLSCIRKSDFHEMWKVKAYSWAAGPSEDQEWSYEQVSDDFRLGDFPQSTAAGTYYFACEFSFVGQWGALCQYSSTYEHQAALIVDEISVTY